MLATKMFINLGTYFALFKVVTRSDAYTIDW